MKRLAILGASGHGKVVAEIAELSGWADIVFFDDACSKIKKIGIWAVLGNTTDLLDRISEFDGCIVAIGNNTIRLEKSCLIQRNKGNLVSLVHPCSIVSRLSEVGLGSVVMAGAVINPFVKLGVACVVNTIASIDHDCILGDGVHISPGVNLAGGVILGQKSWVGIGASVKQCVSIGDNVIVGAGAAVISNVPNELVVAGVPAKVISRNI
ncbi:MAG: acetyltransferase [Methylomarinum sp.]|nr:acetyltransferase [Methylomarinum sp.]